MLYVIATPLGNLGDFSLRAIETLKTCDYILCEDTRHSSVLLRHYHVDKPLRSYHKFNEKKKEEQLLTDLRTGLNICLISDGGTPTLCDPGQDLVRKCREEQIPITTIPGPCALIAALSLSGIPAPRFQFIGFLPKKKEELTRTLEHLLSYEGVSIAYETPHRILSTLSLLVQLSPTRTLSLARELTKLHEEFREGSPAELLSHLQTHTPKGEMVLLFHPPEDTLDWSHLTIEDHVFLFVREHQSPLSDAIKMVAQLRGIPKRDVYNLIHRS